MSTSTSSTCRVSPAELAARVASWRRARGARRGRTTALVAAAERGIEIPRNTVEALACLPVRHGR